MKDEPQPADTDTQRYDEIVRQLFPDTEEERQRHKDLWEKGGASGDAPMLRSYGHTGSKHIPSGEPRTLICIKSNAKNGAAFSGPLVSGTRTLNTVLSRNNPA
jgi:hypothetical protein